ncbi:MAG: regulatory protein RecX [Chloroflexota bacterium]
MRHRLARHGFESQVIDSAVVRLKGEKLVDDAAFAGFWVDNRVTFSPRSRRAIRAELMKKGVGREVVAEAVEGVDDEAAAYQVGLKKTRLYHGGGLEEFREFLMPFLLRRGFGREMSLRAVERLWEEAQKERNG